MCTDNVIRKFFRLLSTEPTLAAAARKAGISEKTARKYRRARRLPSELKKPHTWRTRQDPFQDVWSEVVEKLKVNPGLQATTLFQDLQRRHRGKFQDGQLRTFQRRIKQWKAQEGPPKEVRFRQEYVPGERSQSDFTHMNTLGVTIQRVPFKHMLYHFVLPYSHWEAGTICVSESFESLSTGLQNALAACGGAPALHQTDSLSAAVRNCKKDGEDKEVFTERYQALMRHYGMTPRHTQPASPQENGAIEQRHYRFKRAVADALGLRGSLDFESRAAYTKFIADIFKQLNAGRRQRFKEEAALLRDLPQKRLEHFTRRQARVSNTSTITVQRNTYSVQSRLIGEKVEVRVYPERLEVWYGQRKRETMPRPSGRGHHHVQYRHVIDWLVRKPWAFPRYRYRDAFFPTHIFRMTYDRLRRDRRTERAADQAYLRILHLAALNGEVHVEAALPSLLKDSKPINQEAVVSCRETPVRSPTTLIAVERTKLGRYNDLVPGLAAGDGASVAVTLTAHLDAMGITPSEITL